MVSLTYHDEHVAWQQRVQKEITHAHRFQNSHTESFKTSISPSKRPHNRSSAKPRARSSVYSNLPAANINLGAMNVYAEVRGKYSRNANKTINTLPQVSGVVSRPSTSGSLVSYNRRYQPVEEARKPEVVEEPARSIRPLKEEVKVSVRPKRENEKKDDDKVQGELQDLLVIDHENKDGDGDSMVDDEEKDKVDDLENLPNDEDRKTEMSFKTTSSQRRYIEELENLLKEERIRRIEAEEKLDRISTSHSKKRKN